MFKKSAVLIMRNFSKIAIGSNPPRTEDFQKSPIPLNPVGIPTMSNVGQFSKFCYVSSYMHLKSFAWKRDCLLSQKLQMPKSSSTPF